VDDELINAYLETNYVVFVNESEVVIKIGEQLPKTLIDLLSNIESKSWAFITAWNPSSQLTTDEINLQQNSQLFDEMSINYLILEGIGKSKDGNWSEASYFVVGISRSEASEVGKKYRQNAILYGEPEPELMLLYDP
jgi:hypothetical protein